MTSLQPYSYGVKTVNVIRQALAGYGGGGAFAAEMIQNADDAKASQIAFYFTPEALEVRNNSVFSESDFKSICDIAGGYKGDQPNQIGTWGTGFLSVYRYTDAPELESARQKLVFDPLETQLVPTVSLIDKETLFRFPWRTRDTQMGRKLEAPIWSPKDILELKNATVSTAYGMNLFLRHIKTIAVYEGNGTLLYKVTRRKLKETRLPNGCKAVEYEMDVYQRGRPTITDTWLYYHQRIASLPLADSITVKDDTVTLAFPREARKALDDSLPGTLYNFLPTPIRTGFPFQINGAFFPDNNRQTVLTDHVTHRDKARWNHTLITSLADLLVNILVPLRNRLPDQRRFYELLPLNKPYIEFLRPLYDNFFAIAPQTEIIFSSLNQWCRPNEVLLRAPASRLPELATKFLHLVPAGATQRFLDFLSQELKVPYLEWTHLVKFLEPHLQVGQTLTKSHPMINSREKLGLLYDQIRRAILSQDQKELLQASVLCLTTSNELRPFNANVWYLEPDKRQLIADIPIDLVDVEFQEQYPQLFESLLPKLRGRDIVEWLVHQDFTVSPLTSSQMPTFLQTPAQVRKLVRFLADDLSGVNTSLLARLPLIRTTKALYHRGVDVEAVRIFSHNDETEREFFGRRLALEFIDPDFMDDPQLAAVYREAGVRILQPKDLLSPLRERLPDWSTEPQEMLIEELLVIYDYFERQHAKDLGEALRRLPLCLTQQGRLVAAYDDTRELQLSSRFPTDSNAALRHLATLQIDNLIHYDLEQRSKRFLSDILRLKPIDPSGIILNQILPNYDNVRLTDAARMELLQYVLRQITDLGEREKAQMWMVLEGYPLILSEDGKYRKGKSLYFPSTELDELFLTSYPRPHAQYDFLKATGEERGPSHHQRNKWYALFVLLGVNSQAQPDLLFEFVNRIVQAGPPTEERINAVRRIYDFLVDQSGKGWFITNEIALSKFRTFAWLPARDDTQDWHVPSAVYQAQVSDLIGDQAPVMAYRQATQSFAKLLGLPLDVPVDLVARHLLASIERGQGVSARVYGTLGREWHKLDAQFIEQFQQQSVVWDVETKRYWRGIHVFFTDQQYLFGNRRYHIPPPPDRDTRHFLKEVGVRERPDAIRDSLDLLVELVTSGSTDPKISHADRELLLRLFDHLGRQDTSRDQLRLSNLKWVPARDGTLHPPHRVVIDDHPSLMQCFDEALVPSIKLSDMTIDARVFLQRLGVPLLTKIVERRPVSASAGILDNALTMKLRALTLPFRRIALSVIEVSNLSMRALDLTKVRVFKTPKLTVAYTLVHKDPHGNTWRIPGIKQDEDSVYDADNQNFYIKTSTTAPFIPIARELVRHFFPHESQSTTALIATLLQMGLTDIDKYLDELDYRPLPAQLVDQDALPVTPVSVEVENYWSDSMAVPLESEATEATAVPVVSIIESKEFENLGQPQVPTFEANPKSKDVAVTQIPTFQGDLRPEVPILPNDYDALRNMGLAIPHDTKILDAIANRNEVSSDTLWTETEATPGGLNRGQTVRFTLTFQNRTQGYLPLHDRARQLFIGQPSRLECMLDGESSPFDLYVDWKRNLIYNTDILPQLFASQDIPAGGIIYLEKLHGIKVRLFWQRTTSHLENVTILELQQDGSLEVFTIPHVDYPCEVAEYVVRAEKRLEDTPALFVEARNKHGIFQTLCELFGTSGAELTYEEIFRGMSAHRHVAHDSIRTQLAMRPCFVKLGDDRWRFVPENGYKRAPNRVEQSETVIVESTDSRNARATSQNTDSNAPNRTPTPVGEVVEVIQRGELAISSPFLDILDSARQELLGAISLIERAKENPQEYLRLLMQNLVTFLNELRQEMDALTPVPSSDTGISYYWQQVTDHPYEQLRTGLLIDKLQMSSQDARSLKETEEMLREHLANTPLDLRQTVFFPILRAAADRVLEADDLLVAQMLYHLLLEHNVVEVTKPLKIIARRAELTELLQLVDMESSPSNRWGDLADLWQDYDGDALLRKRIQHQLETELKALPKQIEKIRRRHTGWQSEVDQAVQWLKWLAPVGAVWHSTKLAGEICQYANRLFNLLVVEVQSNKGDLIWYERGLEIVALLPQEVMLLTVSLQDIIDATMALSKTCANTEAAGLLAYACATAERYGWKATSPIPFVELANHYQILGLYKQAYRALEKAQRLSSGQLKREFGQQLLQLHQLQLDQSVQEAEQRWDEFRWKIDSSTLIARLTNSDLLMEVWNSR